MDAARAAALAASAAVAEPPAFEVWEENWDTFLFFLHLRNQWAKVVLTYSVPVPGGGTCTVSESRRDCLPIERVESAARMRGVPRSRWPQLLADVMAMEAAVLEKDAELAAQRQQA